MIDTNILGDDGTHENVLELGIVGWDDDSDVVDLGTDGGPSFLKVTLFKGRDVTETLKPNKAQGQQIQVRIPSGVFAVPPVGTEVLIAWPGSMGTKAGAAVVIAALSRVESTATYGNAKPGDVVLHPGNADSAARIIMKADSNNITIYTEHSGSPVAMVFSADDGSIKAANEHGAMSIDSDGFKVVTGDSGLQMSKSGDVNLNCKTFTVNGNQFAANVGTTLLGSTAVALPTNAAVHGPSGMSGVGSSSVYVGV